MERTTGESISGDTRASYWRIVILLPINLAITSYLTIVKEKDATYECGGIAINTFSIGTHIDRDTLLFCSHFAHIFT